MTARDGKIVVGVFGAAKGIRGEVAVVSHTSDPAAIADFGPLSGSDGRTYVIRSLRVSGKALVARVDGIADRTAAEKLAGIRLMVERERLPADLDDDEFYHEDLVGLSALSTDGGKLGRISAVHNFGAGDILELALAGGKSVMIPFSLAAVPVVAMAQGHVVVDPAAAGLVDDGSRPEDEQAPDAGES